PSSRTRTMMSRTMASTSSDTSRLVVRKAAKRRSKSASSWFKRSGIGKAPFSALVARTGRGFPCPSKVGKPCFDELDVEADRSAAGKHQLDDPFGRIHTRLEAHRQQG